MDWISDLLNGKVRLWLSFWIVMIANSKAVSLLAFLWLEEAYWLISLPYMIFALVAVVASSNNYTGPPLYATGAKAASCVSIGFLLFQLMK